MKKPVSLSRHFLAVLVPGVLYGGLFLARPLWFDPHCSRTPELCSPGSLNGMERLAFSYQSVFADFCSNVLQNSVGAVAFLLPWAILRPWSGALRMNSILLSMTLWNGVLLELVRALIQRPRPQVWGAPLTEGQNIHLYTSFYSGHTSFVALATLFTALWIRSEKPAWIAPFRIAVISHAILTLSTGALRVAGGRHFPSDVIAGWIFGAFVCLAVFRSSRGSGRNQPSDSI